MEQAFVVSIVPNRLSIGGAFERQVEGAVLDLAGDDANEMRKQQNKVKW